LFQLDSHIKRQSLRKPSIAKAIFPHLTNAHYLCSECRKKISNLCEKAYQNVAPSSEVMKQGNLLFILYF